MVGASSSTLCFLDIDIDASREAYLRCAEFVSTNDIRYGLTSKDLTQLGGRELQAVHDFYAQDFDWSSRGRIQTKPQPFTRIVVELYENKAPLAVENFVALCTGSKGKAKGAGIPMHYKGCRFHRIIPGFVAQGGDYVFGNGSGGESIWGKKFKDEREGLKLKHNEAGVLSMCNSGKNSNGSQFFFTLGPAPQCDGKHVVFGRVVSGLEVLEAMQVASGGGGGDGKPDVEIVVTECGLFDDATMLRQGYWGPDGTFLPPDAPRGEGQAPPPAGGSSSTGGGGGGGEHAGAVLVLAPSVAAGEKFKVALSGTSGSGSGVLITTQLQECLSVLQQQQQQAVKVVVVAPAVNKEELGEVERVVKCSGGGMKVLVCRPNEVTARLQDL